MYIHSKLPPEQALFLVRCCNVTRMIHRETCCMVIVHSESYFRSVVQRRQLTVLGGSTLWWCDTSHAISHYTVVAMSMDYTGLAIRLDRTFGSHIFDPGFTCSFISRQMTHCRNLSDDRLLLRALQCWYIFYIVLMEVAGYNMHSVCGPTLL